MEVYVEASPDPSDVEGKDAYVCTQKRSRNPLMCGGQGILRVREALAERSDVEGGDTGGVRFCSVLGSFPMWRGDLCVFVEASVDPPDVWVEDASVCTWKRPRIPSDLGEQ